MKLRTGRLTDMRGDDATIHDAAAAHALMHALSECARNRQWILNRASELMREWGFDSGEVE